MFCVIYGRRVSRCKVLLSYGVSDYENFYLVCYYYYLSYSNICNYIIKL